MQREIFRLIEAAVVFAPRMQGDRNNDVCVTEQCVAAFAHQRAEARRDRSAALVLQRVNDFFHAAFVMINSHGARQGVMARELFVDAWREPQCCPAFGADRSSERIF